MEHTTEQIMRLVIQLAVILIAAKLAGELFERFLKMPAVLGELAAGIAIGPFALGGFDFPLVGALFEQLPDLGHEADSNPIGHISEPLWAIAQVGSIVLLFFAGLETDLRQFLRYARPATLVAIGGVVLPFVFGNVLTVVFGYAEGFGDVKALFIGAVMTATSIGITVRVMSDLRRLGTPEGVTILGAAVLDDVVGILILTVVVGLANTGDVSIGSIGFIAFKTIGFWLALTGIGILASRHISRFLQSLRVSGAAVALSLALALLAAGLAESFGLAMIIGAFSIGLALSDTDLAHKLEKPLMAVYAALVPIFFVVMGMLVDVRAMGGVIALRRPSHPAGRDRQGSGQRAPGAARWVQPAGKLASRRGHAPQGRGGADHGRDRREQRRPGLRPVRRGHTHDHRDHGPRPSHPRHIVQEW